MEPEYRSVEFENRDDLAEQTPWLSPNGRSRFMAQWVVSKYDGTHYMEWNKSVQEWVRQSKIILENTDD